MVVWPQLEIEEMDMLAEQPAGGDAGDGFVEFKAAQLSSASILQFRRHARGEAQSLAELLAHADHVAAAIGSRQMRMGANEWNFLLAFDKPVDQLRSGPDSFGLVETFREVIAPEGGAQQVFESTRTHFGFNDQERRRSFAKLAVINIAQSMGRVVVPYTVLPLEGGETSLFPYGP